MIAFVCAWVNGCKRKRKRRKKGRRSKWNVRYKDAETGLCDSHAGKESLEIENLFTRRAKSHEIMNLMIMLFSWTHGEQRHGLCSISQFSLFLLALFLPLAAWDISYTLTHQINLRHSPFHLKIFPWLNVRIVIPTKDLWFGFTLLLFTSSK